MDGPTIDEAAVVSPAPADRRARRDPPTPDLGGDARRPSASIAELRAQLEAETGGTYRPAVQALAPRYGRVWRDIALGYLALALILGLVGLPAGPWAGLAQVGLGAVGIGYALAFLQLFIHEAAHANLAPDRRVNDRLANLFIAWHLGADITAYRATHLVHHAHHGLPSDSENSYFNALTPGFLLASVTGVHAVRVFLNRTGGGRRGGGLWPLARGLLVHALLLAALLALGGWRPALAWVIGVGAFLPLFGALRQLLEHRSPEADPTADYARTPHGAHTRVFRGGPFAKTFGGAGFDRHLLHHWEPQVSYTRLAELEDLLRATSAREAIEANTTTYLRAARQLWRDGGRRKAA